MRIILCQNPADQMSKYELKASAIQAQFLQELPDQLC